VLDRSGRGDQYCGASSGLRTPEVTGEPTTGTRAVATGDVDLAHLVDEHEVGNGRGLEEVGADGGHEGGEHRAMGRPVVDLTNGAVRAEAV
jgi:hypothetical protein